MSRIVLFDPEAREELLCAADYYEAQRARLGDALVEAVEVALSRIVERPAVFPSVAGLPTVRRALVSRFPYAVVFTETRDGNIFVVAVAHGKRQPLYWARRIEP